MRRIEVLPDGRLTMSAAHEGPHTCMLVNAAGGVRAQSYITVVPTDLLPPPLLTRTPPNSLTLPAGTPATLPCRARGPPQVTIQWFRGNMPLRTLPPWMSFTKEGDLEFSGKGCVILLTILHILCVTYYNYTYIYILHIKCMTKYNIFDILRLISSLIYIFFIKLGHVLLVSCWKFDGTS